MKTVKITGQFKKDLKRYKHKKEEIAVLEEVLKILRAGEEIPPEYYPHPLTGNYKGHMECHVEGDLLLIWLDQETDTIHLVRFGTHSELF